MIVAVCALLWSAGCRSVSPGQALASTTLPLSPDERLTYLGEASGQACRSMLLWLFMLDNDGSIHEAKQDALRRASIRYQRQAVALVDVSIDFELTSYVVYERNCTWIRGKALALEARAE